MRLGASGVDVASVDFVTSVFEETAYG